MKIMVINGPSINFIGIREPEIYGNEGYEHLKNLIIDKIKKEDITATVTQSNSEGEIVSFIQEAYYDSYDGIIINPAAYSHYSIAILDAIKSVDIPCVEVHISNISSREDFRQSSITAKGCIAQVAGFGLYGYILAIDGLVEYIKNMRA